MDRDAIRGRLAYLLLTLIDAKPSHAYELIVELRERSGGEFDLPEGTIYPALHKMRETHDLDADIEVVGHRRVVYRITEQGRRRLVSEAAAWERLKSAVDRTTGSVVKDRRRHLTAVPD